MKAMPGIAVLSLSLLGLAACTSTGSMYANDESAKVEGVQERHVVDSEYVAAVERIARKRGVQVEWVHPPLKRVTVDQ